MVSYFTQFMKEKTGFSRVLPLIITMTHRRYTYCLSNISGYCVDRRGVGWDFAKYKHNIVNTVKFLATVCNF